MMITYQTKVPVSIDALHSFERTYLQARFSRVVGQAIHKNVSLLDFDAVTCRCGQPDRHYAGIQTVPVRQIRGSEGRSDDFDRNFNPLHTRMRQRWVGVYTAWEEGKVMPPVELVQVGDEYYVRDGHHRISVAHALGNSYIDAEVTVLESPKCPLNKPIQ
ncbi:MAG: hypothetical protein ACWGO1_12565 [Anaerolineales bacterium]